MALGDLGIEKIGMVAVMDAAHFHQLVDVVQEGLGVVAHAARVVIDDMLERRQLILDLEQFVNLLLILDDGETDAGVLHHEEHFGGDRILVQRHRHAAERLGGAHHHVQMRPVVADDGKVVATLETEFGEAAGQRPDTFCDVGPRPGLPDPEILLAHRRRVGTSSRVIQQQARKSMQPIQRPEICLDGHSCLLFATPRRDAV